MSPDARSITRWWTQIAAKLSAYRATEVPEMGCEHLAKCKVDERGNVLMSCKNSVESVINPMIRNSTVHPGS